MSKKLGAIALVIAILALGLSVYVLVDKLQTPAPVVHDVQYEIYLGTNDKDTHQPYGTPEACMAKVDEVLTKPLRASPCRRPSAAGRTRTARWITSTMVIHRDPAERHHLREGAHRGQRADSGVQSEHRADPGERDPHGVPQQVIKTTGK